MTLALYGKSRRRQWMLAALALFALLGAVSAAFAVRQSASAATGTVNLNPAHVGVVNDTFTQGSCPTPPSGQENWYGWHFILPANADFTSLSVTFQAAGTLSANPFPGSVFIASPDNSHAYVWTETNDKLLSGTATYSTDKKNPPDKFNLSHVCSGSETPPDPAVSVDKSHTPAGPFTPGGTFDWIITVSVTGATTDADTTITDQLPAQFDYGTLDASGFTNCTIDGTKLLTCTLPAGKAVYDYTITIPVTVPEGIEECGVVENSVSITGNNVISPASDTDSVTVICGEGRTLEVCKVVETDSAAGGVFTIKVEGQSDFVTTNIAPGGDDCTTYSVADGAEITITETGFPAGWVSAEFYPTVSANGDNIPGDTITVTVGEGTCEPPLVDVSLDGQETAQQVAADCTVVFYNKTDGQTESRGLILVEKYIEIDGNLGTTLPGEGLVAGWTVTVDGVSKQTTLPATVTFEATVGDTVPVSETTQAGYVVLGHTINGGSLAGGSSTSVQVSEATTLVRFYNQPLGSLNVHKDAVTSHNGGPNVPAPQDDDGWSITVSSATCNFTDTKQTDASGNASFTNLPMCTDYVVSENPVNAASPGFAPISATSVSNQTPSGQTITFVNRRVTFDPPCQDCIQIIPTPTPTTVPPTATPTNTAVPPTATPTPEEATEGEKTPGPTPIAPSTGTGGSGGSGSMNILLLALGLAALSGGMSLAAAGRRRRN